ncbi:MAG TPA: hybrid sensor histidine kinase/response regulator [Ottowia sp.]|nr:hybrid sensor histidine kinase/response regulator [Ottowia sp.]
MNLWPLLQVTRQRLMLGADAMATPGADADKRLRIERQMLDLLADGVRQALLTSIVIGPLLTAWLTLPHIGALRAVAPLLLLLALGAERALLLRRIRRERALQDDAPRRWARALGVRLVLGSFVVLVWFHFVIESGNRILISEMVALLTILAAGGAALFSSWPPVMWAVVSSLLLGMAVQLALVGEPERWVEAVFCLVLWLVLVLASLRTARTLHGEALALLRNEDLVRELRDKHARAEAANAAKSRFFAAANHDLRQPLHALRLYLGLLRPREDDAREGDALARARQCLGVLDGLLVALLDVSRLDSGQLTATRSAFALQPLFDRLAGMHEAQARQKGLQLRVRPTSAWVDTDAMLLERALINLLTNALRYTYQGGVLLAAHRQGGQVRVRVVDTGVGIAESAQEAVFDEFVQLDNPERDPALGYGLGLPTVRRLAALLGLNLRLRSRPGRGSVFTLVVPAVEPGAVSRLRVGSPQPQPSAPLQGRVLVVEDNALARDALVRQLQAWGLQVYAAIDGGSACAALAESSFDAVLSDWRLPGAMDGAAVLREAGRQLPGLRLAALITGEDTPLLAPLAAEFTVLRKPLRPRRLRTLLSRYLSAG